jgi:uncharacterized protein (TIGR02453 family)
MEKILRFLTQLNLNNNKEWFHSNRKLYEESRDKMLFYTEVFINEIRKFDDGIPALDPKECLFRIFRDIRFSNDKRPYKTNMGSYIAKGGHKLVRAGYYIHIEPGASFAGGGIYLPPSEPLKAVRTAIYENPEEYIELTENENFKKIFTEFYGEKLKTAPQGFPKDFKYIGLLLPKSYAYGHQLDDSAITSDKFIETIVEVFRNLSKVNQFLNEALEKYF